jgi:restriction endonuclease-like protein
VIVLATSARLLFEIKYSEKDFGKATEDAKHLEKFETIYRPRLGSRFEERYCSAKLFLENYQILRNIRHLDSGDMVVFLYPRSNASLKRKKKEHIIQGCAVEPFRSGVHIRYMEDILVALQQHPRLTPAGSAALEEFRLKYFPAQ